MCLESMTCKAKYHFEGESWCTRIFDKEIMMQWNVEDYPCIVTVVEVEARDLQEA